MASVAGQASGSWRPPAKAPTRPQALCATCWHRRGANNSYGYTIHNLPQGYVKGEATPVSAGVKYLLKFQQRGQLDSDDAQGDWRVRGQFYDASGMNLGVQEICAGATVTPTWQANACYFYPPGNATSVKLQLWLVQASGWVTFDDITLDSKVMGNGSYYYFGGQRIAMLDNEGLKYIHTAPRGHSLNSTTLLTDEFGNPVLNAAPRYYAYAPRGYPERTPGRVIGLPTEYAFTGQRQDNLTGLIYMNTRYYDPELGIFIGCPQGADTLIPDPMNVMDFNRYMYVRGNPLKYNDPSGHCILGLGICCRNNTHKFV